MALRAWSSVRVSNRLIVVVLFFVAMTQAPLLIFYTVTTQPTVCLGQPNLFQKVNGFWILIVWSVIPFIGMLVFDLLTIRHVRRSVRIAAVRNAEGEQYRHTRFVDRQLIQITMIQSLLFMSTSAAGAVGGMFNILDDNTRKDPLLLAQQGLIGNVLSFVGLLGPCVSFYLCTLASRLFRHELLIVLCCRRPGRAESVANMAPLRQ